MTGERSAIRSLDIPNTFEEWGTDARVNYVRNAMRREDILTAVVHKADCQDKSVTQALTKDQATEVLLYMWELESEAGGDSA